MGNSVLKGEVLTIGYGLDQEGGLYKKTSKNRGGGSCKTVRKRSWEQRKSVQQSRAVRSRSDGSGSARLREERERELTKGAVQGRTGRSEPRAGPNREICKGRPWTVKISRGGGPNGQVKSKGKVLTVISPRGRSDGQDQDQREV